MFDHHSTASRVRAAALWAVITLGGLGIAALAGPEVRDLLVDPGPTFDKLLTQICAAAALLAAAMLWMATCDVAWAVLRSPAGAVRRSVGPVRGALLAACGVAVVASVTTAGAAAGVDTSGTPLTATSIDGLPLPDRAEGGGPTRSAAPHTVQVSEGDSLWSISADVLGPGATDTEISNYWQLVYARNAPAIGADPDLILPGTPLRLPPTH